MGGIKTVIQQRYKVLEQLGEGGTATVFLTEDLRLGRKTAVKRLLAGNPFFEREVALLQSLSLPELPVIYDAFTEKSGISYIVMEYVSGIPLSRFMEERGILPDEQLYLWGKQLGEFLQKLHSGTPPVLYRDLKPDNIIVTEEGKLRLVDLGASVSVSGFDMRENCRVGSVGYASPEQWEGVGADPRSDLYSLGMVLRELLEYGEGELVGRRISAFQSVINKCTAYERENRYASAEEFLKAWDKAHKKNGKCFLGKMMLAVAEIVCLIPAAMYTAERAGLFRLFAESFTLELPSLHVIGTLALYATLKICFFAQKKREGMIVEKTIWCRN